MASGNMKDIKRRIKSVESTMQITKAMELVASSKLRKAKEKADNARPYFNALYDTMCEIQSENPGFFSQYTKNATQKPFCWWSLPETEVLRGALTPIS